MTTVKDFGARGDGQTDDTAAITHAVQNSGGDLIFPQGDYRITRPIHIPLQLHGRMRIAGDGGTAKIIMAGEGPALHLVGTHRGTAGPDTVQDNVWQNQRMPTIRDLEIVGDHRAADGVRVEGVMQPTFHTLLIRNCRHGIHLANRDRNVIISDCHIYNNTGVGVFLDRVNLHQINIHGNHISYNKLGGIRIAGSEIRNIQICSNDIEYNYDLKNDASADVLLDCREGTVREGTIIGNTIQARQSPNGANVRMLGAKDHPNAVGLFAITGNLIGSQETAIHLRAARGVAISGNSIYSGYRRAIWCEQSEHIVIGANSIDHNPQYRGNSSDRVVLHGCHNLSVTGLVQQHTLAATDKVDSSMEIRGCRNVNLTGCQIINGRVRGVALDDCRVVRIADCTIRGGAGDKTFRAPLDVAKNCREVMVVNNFLGRGSDGEWQLPDGLGTATGNVVLDD